MRALIFSLIIAAGMSGCSHADRLLVSGHSINAVGEQFLIVAEFMTDAVKSDNIAEEDFGKWVAFGKKFQATYPSAVHIWQVARLAQDEKLERQAMLLISELIPELLKFAAMVQSPVILK